MEVGRKDTARGGDPIRGMSVGEEKKLHEPVRHLGEEAQSFQMCSFQFI